MEHNYDIEDILLNNHDESWRVMFLAHRLLHIRQEARDQNERLPPPASKDVVGNLEEIQYEDNTGMKQCPICIKEYEKGVFIKILPCKHSFHKNCIEIWLQKTNSCPLCRYELLTDDEDYENYKKEKKRAAQRELDLEILHNSMYG